MKEYKKANVSRCAGKILGSTIILDLLGERYDYLLELNINGIIQKFNNGEYDIIFSEEISKFADEKLQPIDLIECIIECKSLLDYKKQFFEAIQKEKDGMVYDSERVYHCDKHYYRGGTYTYSMIEKAFEMAENIVNGNKVYMLLSFILKYGSLRNEISSRKSLFDTLKSNPDKTRELLTVLSRSDSDIGVIKVVEEYESVTTTVEVGTRQDMEISNLISMPFLSDRDDAGYNYGPYGDYYNPAHKVTKEFCDMGTTPKHAKMIADETGARSVLKYKSLIDEEGYILSNGYALIINKSVLVSFGIDPKRVGWKPMKLRVSSESLLDTLKRYESTKYLPIMDKIQLKAETLIKGRQH